MPVFIVMKLCSKLRIVPVRMKRYKMGSKLVGGEVLGKCRMRSMDEASLNVKHLVSVRPGSYDH